MATLKDVAKDAGVGVSTASIVLSGGRQLEQIPEVTRQRIRDAAMKLKYRPNAGGRQLRHNKTGTIALFLSAEANRSSLSVDLLYSVNDELLKYDYSLNFVRLDDSSLKNPEYTPRFLRQNEVDGVIVNYNVDMPQRFVDMIHYYEIPAIFMNVKRQGRSIYFNHYDASYRAIEKMIGLGHKSIYFINYTGIFHHYSVNDTIAGYVDAMKAHSLTPVMCNDRIERQERVKDGIKVLKSGMNGHNAPTAIMAMNISTVIPLVQAAGAIGMKVPEELSVCTTDSSNLPTAITPAISHIYLPWREAGTRGVQMLLKMIEGRDDKEISGCIECEWREAGNTVVRCRDSK